MGDSHQIVYFDTICYLSFNQASVKATVRVRLRAAYPPSVSGGASLHKVELMMGDCSSLSDFGKLPFKHIDSI